MNTVASSLLTPVSAASSGSAALRYVSDVSPGIRRQWRGKGFVYIGLDGSVIHDPEELKRIQALHIPPAWTEVWICPLPHGHLQATGRDAKGRKQYRYHPLWSEIQSQTKYDRALLFAEALPSLREHIERDLALPGLPRRKVLAAVVLLLEKTFIRVGNKEYERINRSFGLTTLHDEHVEITGDTLQFRFRGKRGQEHTFSLKDRRLAKIVKQAKDIPGYELFQYIDEQGVPQTIDSGDVNAYLREITQNDFSAKDFRTWGGTLLAAVILKELGPCAPEDKAKKHIVETVKQVARCLGNRPATCRKYYIHPVVLEAYLNGAFCSVMEQQLEAAIEISHEGLTRKEAALMAILRASLNGEARTREMLCHTT